MGCSSSKKNVEEVPAKKGTLLDAPTGDEKIVTQTGFDLSKESYDSPADALTLVAPGVWSICSRHQPGMNAAMPGCNNRSWVLKIVDKEAGDFLLVYGLPSCKDALPRIQAIERTTGLKTRYVMSSGDWHHLYLSEWLQEPELASVKFFMGGVKFPRTRNGKAILGNPEYQQRIQLYMDTVPQVLAKYPNQVQFLLASQHTIYEDQEPLAKDMNSVVTPEDMPQVMGIMGQPMRTRFVCAHLYHPPTKTLSLEHSFDMFWPQSVVDGLADEMKPMFPAEKIQSFCSSMGCICDAKVNWAQCKAMMALDVRCLVDMHVPPTVTIKSFAGQDEFLAELTRVFEASGEVDDGAKLPEGKLAV